MNREDYQQVKEIFQDALDIAPDKRAEYLNEKCSDNPFIRHEIERLLSSFDSDYLEQPAVGQFAEKIVSKSNLSIGQKIGHYKIIKKIGAGGMGEVFLAEDIELERRAALKVLPANFAANKAHLERFVREAKAVSALNHPNILTVYEIGQIEDSRFIAAEYIEGKTLRQHLQNAPLELNESLNIALQIISAVQATHAHGIIHRDIKPENVMIRDDGIVKVLDFGLVKLINKAEGRSEALVITTAGMILGTTAYMSPEQAQGITIDERTDLWSVGVVLYEMLTGKQPFVGETSVDTLTAILISESVPPVENLPTELNRILQKALQRNREARYQTARRLLTDLKDVKDDLEFHDRLERSAVPNQRANKTKILPTAITDENKNQLTKSVEYFVTQVKKPKFIYLALVVLMIAGIGFGIYRYRTIQPTNILFESVKIAKITDSGKVGDRVALSRDGKWLAYSIVDGAKASLWLKQVAVPDSNTEIVPPAETYYQELSFSPDANYLYYSIMEGIGNQMTVYQMPVLGGGTTRKFLSGINGGINFSPDGTQITYGVEDLETDESILMVADADGTNQRQLVKLKGNDEIASSRGRWSPDGKSIALWVGTNNPKTQELATVSVATGEITRLVTPKFEEFFLWEWLPDSKGFIVLGNKPKEKREFWHISLPSGEAEKITNDLDDYSSLSLSADSSILATVQGSGTASIWIAPVGDAAQATQVTSGSNSDFDPQWTPDGKLVFERVPGYICIVDPRGGSPQRLTTNSGNRFPKVSRDGRYIVYVSSQSGTPNIWRMDIDGGNPKQLTTEFSVEPSISPDSREIIYSVGADSSRIWKVGIDGGQPVQLTDKESRNAVFSPDGKQFYCLWWDSQNSQPKFAIIPATGGNPVKTFAFNGGGFRWMPDGRSFLFAVRKDNAFNIWSQPIDSGKPKQLTNFPNIAPSFDLSPDGKQIAVSRGTGSSDVVLITGFRK